MCISYSVIIPAYNEEAWLPSTLEALQQAMNLSGMAGEIIVVDNNSHDRTSAVAVEHGATVVFEPINQISFNDDIEAITGIIFIKQDPASVKPDKFQASGQFRQSIFFN